MKFDKAHRQYFGAADGAYSEITAADEEKRRQITLTDHEVEIVKAHFKAANIHTGAKYLNPKKAVKTFEFYNSTKPIMLTLVYPKPKKTELRLYMSGKQGFMPAAGQIWFVFKKDGNSLLTVGYIDKSDWNDIPNRNLKLQAINDANKMIEDPEDIDYQNDIQNLDAKGPQKRSTKVYPRNPKIALNRMKKIGYVCEFDKSHKTFISMKTGNNFVESHHIIPMNVQKYFKKITLDLAENIAVLCPNCHRAIHHGEENLKKKYLNKFFANRGAPLLKKGITITIDKLKEYYGITP
jgi:5-methylcytosine-specific restriction protein A